MLEISGKFNELLVDKIGLGDEMGDFIYAAVVTLLMISVTVGINWCIQSLFKMIFRSRRVKNSTWGKYLDRHRLGYNILLLVPGIIMYYLPYLAFDKDDTAVRFLHRADIIYMIIIAIKILNAVMYTFLDFYSKTDKNRSHPLKGLIQALQVIIYFIGGIIIISILIDKSPTVLLTGLGASAAVLMLIFKDSILGFVAGVQLSKNNMIKLGDWIQMPDGTANGTVEEITLNTVKVRNWDNTLTMIPPYTLVSTPFKNWRGMQESGGRRVDKEIFIDLTSLEILPAETLESICREKPIMSGYITQSLEVTNIQLYRIYIERYLRSNAEVNQTLDIIITQKEVTPYGLPIEVYFFLNDKSWASYEKKQSDIFDHLMTMAAEFGLKLYQRP